ncbi:MULTISPECIES: glycine betaine ABC transporter substrate-binding protein [Streptomyces]|nr:MULTISPECIES: glycine betaine ABC transporter substrate-binding protein [Streptomyces]NNG88183.1 glycine/betaine ABC transporter substrate-binding protein [Streptomyces cacaoi]
MSAAPRTRIRPLRMSRLLRRSRAKTAALAFALLAPLTLGACAGDPGSDEAGTVRLTVPTWTGGEANVAVAAYLLEHELGYHVTTKKMETDDAWRSVGAGKADAILEDWGHPQLARRYVYKKKTMVPAGDVGITGKIGWYVPAYLVDKHPDITDWRKLNRYAPLLRGGRSGDRGQLIEGSRGFVTHDEALLKNLHLDYDAVYTGSESAQIETIQEKVRKHEPFLTYWWRPHWLAADAGLKEVRLPEHYAGCDEDTEAVKCGYPSSSLKKYLSKDFSRKGGKAAEFLKNFQWSEQDQNEVARMIAEDGMTPEAAAGKWVKSNPETWKVWLWGLKGE